jgi:hypothetical protein
MYSLREIRKLNCVVSGRVTCSECLTLALKG